MMIFNKWFRNFYFYKFYIFLANLKKCSQSSSLSTIKGYVFQQRIYHTQGILFWCHIDLIPTPNQNTKQLSMVAVYWNRICDYSL